VTNIQRIAAMLLALPAVYAAELKPETLAAWDQYIQTANLHMQRRLQPTGRFLWIDETPDLARRVHSGEIVASPIGERSPRKIPNGLIHHWIGAAFVSHAGLADIFAVVQAFDRYKEFYAPLVVDSKPMGRGASDFRFSMVLLNKALFSKTALDCECKASYSRLDSKRWYSVGSSTRIRQIEDYSQPGEHELAPDVGAGYIWRLYSLSRFEERDGGVYIEVEAIALSRDIPVTLRWLADPIVRRVSRSSLLTSLQQTRTAVASTAAGTVATQSFTISAASCSRTQSSAHPSGVGAEGLRPFRH